MVRTEKIITKLILSLILVAFSSYILITGSETL
jgi:hypothetical protein